jgi:hypothetical protein
VSWSSENGRVRVALIGCSGLLGDIIGKAIGADPLIEVVARIDPITVGNQTIDADLVLWHNADEAQVASWLRDVHGTPRVLATVGDGRAAALWELAPHRTELGEQSPAVLVQTIHSALEPAARQETL